MLIFLIFLWLLNINFKIMMVNFYIMEIKEKYMFDFMDKRNRRIKVFGNVSKFIF